MPRDWDAATYDRIADPMFRWGVVVLGWLDLHGEERVLDAGSGSGRVTEVLLERLPSGRSVALDGSQSMREHAGSRLARFGYRVEFVLADLMKPLPLDEPVDAIVSTATFHGCPTTTRCSATSPRRSGRGARDLPVHGGPRRAPRRDAPVRAGGLRA